MIRPPPCATRTDTLVPPTTLCPSDSLRRLLGVRARTVVPLPERGPVDSSLPGEEIAPGVRLVETHLPMPAPPTAWSLAFSARASLRHRSEEHTSELQSLMRISYAVFCLKKKILEHYKHIEKT